MQHKLCQVLNCTISLYKSKKSKTFWINLYYHRTSVAPQFCSISKNIILLHRTDFMLFRDSRELFNEIFTFKGDDLLLMMVYTGNSFWDVNKRLSFQNWMLLWSTLILRYSVWETWDLICKVIYICSTPGKLLRITGTQQLQNQSLWFDTGFLRTEAPKMSLHITLVYRHN